MKSAANIIPLQKSKGRVVSVEVKKSAVFRFLIMSVVLPEDVYWIKLGSHTAAVARSEIAAQHPSFKITALSAFLNKQE